MEKIVNELRVVETDDGFRIEIKGDKEQIKAFMTGFGEHKPGPHRHGRRRGAFPFGPLMWMKAASCYGMWDAEVEEEQSVESTEV